VEQDIESRGFEIDRRSAASQSPQGFGPVSPSRDKSRDKGKEVEIGTSSSARSRMGNLQYHREGTTSTTTTTERRSEISRTSTTSTSRQESEEARDERMRGKRDERTGSAARGRGGRGG
jgi:hypothetical protein